MAAALANNNNHQQRQFMTAAGQFKPTASNTATAAAATTTLANEKYSAINSANGSHYTFGFGFGFGDVSITTANCIGGSKGFTALEGSHQLARYAGNGTSLASTFASNKSNSNFDKRDRIKLMELSIINLVESSALAAAERKVEPALERAKEALDRLNALKATVTQEQQLSGTLDGRASHASKPMTTGVSMFELALMVNSNLAGQLRNSGQLQQSVELYMQLCKLASSGAGGQGTSTMASSSQQHEARFLLHRFGINVGNALFELGEHQRALKYYRLTLDRLSSSAGLRNLKIKLMNNIALALLAQQEQEQQPTVSVRNQRQLPVDAITSLNLLLADNLSQPAKATATTTTAASNNGTVSNEGGSSLSNANSPLVCNSNHHRFGLNLIVCHHRNSDLASMMSTLKALVRVDICHQYRRVFDWPSWSSLAMNDRESTATTTQPPQMLMINRDRHQQAATAATTATGTAATTASREFELPSSLSSSSSMAANNANANANSDGGSLLLANEGRNSSSANGDNINNNSNNNGNNGGSDVVAAAHAAWLANELARSGRLVRSEARTLGAGGVGGNGQLVERRLALARQTSVSSLGATSSQRQQSQTPVAESNIFKETTATVEATADRVSYSRDSIGSGASNTTSVGSAILQADVEGSLGAAYSTATLQLDGKRNELGGTGNKAEPLTSGAKQGSSSNSRPLTAAEKCRQVMSCIQEDRLEILIGEKHGQISRSLIMASNLLLDLDNRAQRALSSSSSSLRATPASESETSVFDFCLKLMATSDSYKALVFDLKTNNVSGMLTEPYKLDEAIAVLKGIDGSEQQSAELMQQQQQQQQQRSLSRSQRRAPNAGKSSHMLLSKANAAAAFANPAAVAAATANATSNSISGKSITLARSSMVATNSSLLRLLQRQTKRALDFAEYAIRVDKFNVASWINLANCHYQMNNFQEAELCYLKALNLDPFCWEANYNFALLCRKLGRQYGDLKPTTMSSLIRDRQSFSTMLNRKMVLSVIQLALIYQQTAGKSKQAMAILNELIENSKPVPEIYLLASKLIMEGTTNELPTPVTPSTRTPLSDTNVSESPASLAVTLLRQANREHPYHLPVLERLIALSIRNFNYELAKALLMDCIKIRPDQVRWYRMLAECHRRAADYSESILIYKIAIDAFPQDASCLKALIKLTDELGLSSDKRLYETKLEKLTLSQESNLPDREFMSNNGSIGQIKVEL